MLLQRLEIDRKTYGPNEGRLQGRLQFKSPTSEVTLVLTEDMAQRILELCAGDIVATSKAIANDLRAEVLTQVPRLAAA